MISLRTALVVFLLACGLALFARADEWHATGKQGAVVAGSSAGAMVLCEHYYDPQSTRAVAGLNIVPRTCVLPHHNTFGAGWAPRLAQQLADSVLIGIDERTGMIDEGAGGAWHVYGHGAVTIYRRGQPTAYRAGEVFRVEKNTD